MRFFHCSIIENHCNFSLSHGPGTIGQGNTSPADGVDVSELGQRQEGSDKSFESNIENQKPYVEQKESRFQTTTTIVLENNKSQEDLSAL